VDAFRAKVRVQVVANRQAGRVSRAQLTHQGVGRGRIEGWLEQGYLVRQLPRVYAVGHVAPSVEGDLFAAILYAGPGAMLSHMTAAWWRGLIDYPPPMIHVRTPHRRKSQPGIDVHADSTTQRTWHKQLPVTSLEQTMLDLAASAELKLVRKALGRLDYRYALDTAALARSCGRGRPGSTALNWAIANYDPRFGRTNSPLEDSWSASASASTCPSRTTSTSGSTAYGSMPTTPSRAWWSSSTAAATTIRPPRCGVIIATT
jgi:hypothetical protein